MAEGGTEVTAITSGTNKVTDITSSIWWGNEEPRSPPGGQGRIKVTTITSGTWWRNEELRSPPSRRAPGGATRNYGHGHHVGHLVAVRGTEVTAISSGTWWRSLMTII